MKNPSESMTFLDKCMGDDANYIIEIMMNYHISKNYKGVRDIILGYDSKANEWISSYGESISKRFGGPTGFIHSSSSASPNICAHKDIFIKGEGMTFYDDDIFSIARIHMDTVVKRILDALFTISENVIDYKYITDIIVTEWNIKNMTSIYRNNTSYDTYGELHLRSVEVREKSWKEFKGVVRNNGLMIRDAFKIATIDFLENRANMLNGKI